MNGESELVLLLIGYALGLTFALVMVAGRRRTEPATIVVQQTSGAPDTAGCGAFLIFVLVVLGLLMISGGLS